jgi:DNA-binding Lrp family transcriptional regulator
VYEREDPHLRGRAHPEPARVALSVARPRGGELPLDDADLRIIQLLTAQGRLANRAVATEIGLTEATVAARIRSLVGRGVLGVTATIDWYAAGFHWDAWIDVEVQGRPVQEVARALAELDGVHSVMVVFGPVDLVVHALLEKPGDAAELITSRLAEVRGVAKIRPNITLETLKYVVEFARLPVRPAKLVLPSPIVPVDDLDRAIIDALVTDGRQSNREIARNLEVSEGTVRIRLRRLEDSGLLRIAGQSDPYLVGTARVWAFVGVDVATGNARATAEALARRSEVAIVAMTAGRHDLLILVITRSRARLVELVVDEMRSLPDVRTTETWEVVQTVRLNFQLARLL